MFSDFFTIKTAKANKTASAIKLSVRTIKLPKVIKLKKTVGFTLPFIFLLYSSDNLIRTHTFCANIDFLCLTVNYSFNFSDVWLPGSVASSVRVRNLNSEYCTFSANFTFSHRNTPPTIQKLYKIIFFFY